MNARGELNTDYHLALHRPAGRPQTSVVARVLLANTDRYTRVQPVLAGDTARAQREHAELLRLCRAGIAVA